MGGSLQVYAGRGPRMPVDLEGRHGHLVAGQRSRLVGADQSSRNRGSPRREACGPMAFSLLMSCTPMANTMVTMAGRPSGMRRRPGYGGQKKLEERTLLDESVAQEFLAHASRNMRPHRMRIAVPSFLPKSSSLRCRGVSSSGAASAWPRWPPTGWTCPSRPLRLGRGRTWRWWIDSPCSCDRPRARPRPRLCRLPFPRVRIPTVREASLDLEVDPPPSSGGRMATTRQASTTTRSPGTSCPRLIGGRPPPGSPGPWARAS